MSGCMRPCLCNVPMKSVLPAARSVRMSRSKRELAHDKRWMSLSRGLSIAVSISPCCTTAGSCLWSPTNINRSMDRPSPCPADSIPTMFGSNIWLASSMIARSKCLMLKSAEREFMVEVVATMIWALDIFSLIEAKLGFSPRRDDNRWSLYFGSQLNSFPIRT